MENPLAEFNIHVYLLRLCVLNQYKSSILQIQSNHLVMLCLYIYICLYNLKSNKRFTRYKTHTREKTTRNKTNS